MKLGKNLEIGFEICTGSPIEDLSRQDSFVVGQLGQALDGRIATHTGQSKYINHACGLTHLHQLRATVDAVLVGVGTVNADDPKLTVRLCNGNSPARVIIDPNGRVFAHAKLFCDDGPPVIIITKNDTVHPMVGICEVIKLEAFDNRLQPSGIVAALRNLGMNRILVEGGSRTLSSFIDAGCLDRLHLIVAPVILGSGIAGLNLSAVSHVDAALSPKVKVYHLGHDMLFDCNLAKDN